MAATAPTRRLPAAAWWLGAVSFVNDAASEMVLPLLPALLTGTLGASAATLGGIEGTATAVGSVLKLWGGRVADRTGRHGAFVIGGYALSNLLRPLLALASSPAAVLALRVGDRLGKGLRTAPRDALLTEATPPAARLAAFAVHRALDHAGTIAGAGLAVLLMTTLGAGPAEVFAWSAVPGVCVVVLAVLAVRATRVDVPAAPRVPLTLAVTAPLRRLLVVLTVSRLGFASEMFLLLFAGQRLPLWAVPILWAALHVVKSLASFGSAPLGHLLGPRTTVLWGWGAHAAVFGGFALACHRWPAAEPAPAAAAAIAGLFCAWGLYSGLSEGAEKALVAERAGEGARGTAFGSYHLVTGLASLPASWGFGLVWEAASPTVAFAGGAALAVVAGVGLVAWVPTVERASPP